LAREIESAGRDFSIPLRFNRTIGFGGSRI
jgi:hypothetical protein